MNNNTLSCFTRSPRFSRLHVCVLTHFVLLPLLLSATEYEYGPYTYIVTDNNEAAIIYYDGDNANVSIPSTLGGYPVAVIGDDVFEMCDSLKTVTIPNSVKSIGNGAFCGCDALKSVTIGNSVTNIGDGAFSDCIALPSVIIPNSVKSIGNGAFCGCEILKSVTIGSSVVTIGDGAFSACIALPSVIIPNSVTSIGDEAFSDCTALTSITIGSSVASIGDSAFYGCESLTSVTIGNSVKSIGEYAFEDCIALKTIVMGNSVTNIGDEAFSNCSSLTNITVSAGNPKYADRGGVLFDRSLTTLIQYPCGRSGSYTIPGDVTSIGAYAFSWCAALTSVMISNGVANIGNRAFTQCGSLAVVLFTGNAPTAGNLVFDGTPATLYYFPDTEGWSSSFANRPAVCWNPAFSSTSSASGMFAFTLTGDADANIPVRIEASDSLTAPFWSAVTDTTIPASGTLNFTDADTRPSRFYRLTFPR
ncbi:MAG TPA: leucine-rich repeat domain-containing protein [Kiritimatiellia bacterium]|jgi:hypothetical protein|nr:leucine-rich repeat domain-containing protein [Kiritimatiellia bacterium]HPW75561.1 leucine-rich repeat domain-containing protein [Kiritimatiellia bacterium]HRU18946.1 leucine-rich repeat domain-containing protein [Kiritimatiellia bacterium]